MGAPRKFDAETQERAVRMYRDRRSEYGDSKTAARTHVGALLDMNPATIRNWVEKGRALSQSARGTSGTRPRCRTESASARELRITKSQRDSQDCIGVFRGGGGRPPASVIVDYIDEYRHRFGVDPICTVLREH